MDLRKLSVREFRSQMNKLDEPVIVGDGYWFPNLSLLEEWAASESASATARPGETRDKTPRPGETDRKAPIWGDEDTSAATAREGGSEGSPERESVRPQPRALDPTVATRQLQQQRRDHILRQLQRGTRRAK